MNNLSFVFANEMISAPSVDKKRQQPGDEPFSLKEMMGRLEQDIDRIKRQRTAVRQEVASPLRSKTLAMYDEMLIKRIELLSNIRTQMRQQAESLRTRSVA